jgi:outer membrane immunogenic protein
MGKMKNITIFLAASVLCFISAPAFAREPGSFTGAHAEIITGYDRVDADAVSSSNGLLYGVNAGYDVAAGGVVLGLEAEISDSTAKKRYAGGRTVTDRDLYVGGRIGVPLGDGALAYAKLGYTNARFEYSGDAGEGGTVSGGDNADGLRLGAGLEYQLSDSLFLKGEYRYSNYEAGLSRHQVVTGVGFRF